MFTLSEYVAFPCGKCIEQKQFPFIVLACSFAALVVRCHRHNVSDNIAKVLFLSISIGQQFDQCLNSCYERVVFALNLYSTASQGSFCIKEEAITQPKGHTRLIQLR
jgi:hypothetical protein